MQSTLRAARLATFAFFALNGFLMGMWVVHIPAIEQRTGISHATLGWLLLLLGAGAFAGMQIVGPLADRFGARVVVPASAALCAVALVPPGLATDGWLLGAALFGLGLGNGCLDVAMNSHAVQVEHGYQRAVMSAFHATFSLGGVLAALIGARTLSWDWSPAITLGVAALLGLAVALSAAPSLLRAETAGTANTSATSGKYKATRRIWLLAVLAFLLMLCEGVANDWSTLHLRDVLSASPATAALAYGAFATAMTVGRLLADRLSTRFGPVAILRYGAATAALGLSTAALSPWIPLALLGWASSVRACPGASRNCSAPPVTRTETRWAPTSPAWRASDISACWPDPRSSDRSPTSPHSTSSSSCPSRSACSPRPRPASCAPARPAPTRP
ncbi:MFS transporter [Nocardia brasiliensis]|uniref:MFS transporter n=1 Tax=Nocardia brasiliensis TaxID=37326 RepID=UPI00307CBAC6